MKPFKPLLPLLFLACPAVAGAVQIAADRFLIGVDPSAGEYAAGTTNLIGQGPTIIGFSGNWLEAYGGAQSPDVLDTGLSYAGLTTPGGSVRYSGGGGGRCGRVLSTPYTNASTGTLYIGILLQLEAATSDYRAFELHQGGFDDGGNRKLQIAVGEDVGGLVPASDFALRVNESVGMSLGAHDAEVNLFILRIDFSDEAGSDTITVYRNPTDLTVEANNTATAVLNNLDFVFDRTSFARFTGSTGIAFDELRLATTFNDITGSVNPDADGDGMDDGWEFINMVDDPDEDAAHDNDGLTNLEEFNAGTDPNKADSDDDGINDKPELDGTGNAFDAMMTDPVDADSDDDGLLDGDEVGSANGFVTNPNHPDTDGDGENDRIETQLGTNPLDPESNSAALGNFIIDGTRDSLYGDALALQTVETGFGDNQNELDAAYAAINDGKLYLLLTGNLETNFNKLEILIDSKDGGSSTYASAGNDNTANMDGLIFDTGFTPDYHLIARRGSGKFDLDFADLGAAQFASYIDIFTTGDQGMATTGVPTTSTFATDPSPIGVAHDDSNVAGVGGTSGVAADQVAAAAVTTGVELCIDLADIGVPSADLRICAFINNGAHDFLSNQFLGGVPAGSDNLGSPVGLDLTNLEGEQFFTVPVPIEDPRVISIDYDGGSGDLAITFTSNPSKNYKVETSTDLQAEWMEENDSYPSEAGETTTYTATEAAPLPQRKFYRFTAVPK